MRKQGFIEGTMVGTIATIICKILGLIYVIPFRAIVGNSGGALYGYGYNIYMLFLSLATSGIPIAMSKIISEYNTLEMNYAKERSYKIGSRLIVLIGFISFLIVFIFARPLAYAIIGDNLGGNTIEGVTLVIRVVSTALLVVPIQSVKKGYLQGHKYMVVPQFGNVIEQVVRVLVIVLGSYISYIVLHKSLEFSVAVAISGATLGALVSYSFISYQMRKNEKVFERDAKITEEEKGLTDKKIFKQILFYAVPFILIDLIKSAYNTVDMFTVVRGLTNLGFDITFAEEVLANITTWASKLGMIVISLVVGLSAALVPNIMSDFVKKNFKGVEKRINQSLEILILSAIPMTVGLAFLAEPVWTIFYGNDVIGTAIFRIEIFGALVLTFQSVLVSTTQTLNQTKTNVSLLFSSLVLKIILNIPMMMLFKSIGLPAYYGASASTIITISLVILFLILNLKNKFGINYRNAFKVLGKVLISVGVMFIVLYLLKFVIPISNLTRIKSLIVVIIYGIIGSITYIILTIKLHAYDDILTQEMKDKIIKKLPFKKHD